MNEGEQSGEIMKTLQRVLVAIDNALLRGAMPERTVKQLEVAHTNLIAIGVSYPMPDDSEPITCLGCGASSRGDK